MCTQVARRWSAWSRPLGRGIARNQRINPCKADCPCTSACDAEHGQEAGARAGRPRCQTADAGCTGDHHRALRGEISTPKHGRYTAEAIANRREIATLLRKMNALARDYGLSHAAEAHSGGRLPFCLPRPAYLIGPQTSWHQRQEAIQRLADGVAQADVARTYGVSQATISRLAAPSPFGVGAAAAL
jgi:hypothetical protein